MAAAPAILAALAVAAGFSRRALLGGLAAGAITPAQAQSALAGPLPAQIPKLDDAVGAGLSRLVLARWGDAVLPEAPPFNPSPLTSAQADTQFPYDGVVAALLSPPPAQDGIPRRILVLANPTAPARMVFPDGVDNPDVAGRLQGATVLNLQFLGGRWVTVDGGYQSRRLADGTLAQISGPVAASIGATVQGVLAPQTGCATPWGTALLAEGDAGPWLTRLAGTGYGYDAPGAGAKFSWVVELDALNPLAFPIKRTGLGRLARAGMVAAALPDGRAAVFFSEDAPAGRFYRFITAGPATDGSALDAGTLAVARINGSTLAWLPLGNDVPTLAGLSGAGAAAGGSAFDAPGGIAITPDGTLYLACAGNPARTAADALNPRAGDANGHVLVFTPANGHLGAPEFAGNLALVAGDPLNTPLTQYGPSSECWLTRPRTLSLDGAGRLWIGTDQGGKTSATADGFFLLQTAGAEKFQVSMAYLAPVGAAAGGVAFDAGIAFAMVRHPGATPGASFDAPATRWPSLQPSMPPQSTLIGLIPAAS